MALIEKLTPQFHQDLLDGESSNSISFDVAVSARQKYDSIIKKRITDDFKGKYALAGHVQQLVQKLQRSPFSGIVVSVCCELQSKAVRKETYENDLTPFLNKLQRKDFALFMKRVREVRAQNAAMVEQVRKRLLGQKMLVVVSSQVIICIFASSPRLSSIIVGNEVSKKVSETLLSLSFHKEALLATSFTLPFCSWFRIPKRAL